MRAAPRATSALHPQRANVTGIDATGIYLRIPDLSATQRFGPCQHLETVTSPGEITGAGGTPSHTHLLSAAPLAVGDQVLVVFLNGSRSRPVIIGRLLG